MRREHLFLLVGLTITSWMVLKLGPLRVPTLLWVHLMEDAREWEVHLLLLGLLVALWGAWGLLSKGK